MKGLVWATAALGALALLALVAVRERAGVLVVNPPPAIAATAAARCPEFTLEDNGVCLPLPRPSGARKAGVAVSWVAEGDALSAFMVPWRDAPVAPELASALSPSAPALLVRTRVGSPVACAAPFDDAVVTRADQLPSGAWVISLVSHADAARTVTMTGLTALAPQISVGAACPSGGPLGASGDTLVVWGVGH